MSMTRIGGFLPVEGEGGGEGEGEGGGGGGGVGWFVYR